jgi:hypothetical protein
MKSLISSLAVIAIAGCGVSTERYDVDKDKRSLLAPPGRVAYQTDRGLCIVEDTRGSRTLILKTPTREIRATYERGDRVVSPEYVMILNACHTHPS